MIQLQIPVKLEGLKLATSVVRLTKEAVGEDDAVLVATLGDEHIFQAGPGYLKLPSSIDWAEGDVILVDTNRSVAHRWIRATSPHNTLLITERCDQLCLMCSQPPKKSHYDLFAEIEKAILLAPIGMEIGLSGGEPTLYKRQLSQMLTRVLEARPDLRFHILSNGQHFDESDIEWLSAPLMRNVCWGVPIYAASPDIHDEIVVKVGAFARLMESFAFLQRAGSTVELRTVTISTNVEVLPDLADFVTKHLRFAQVWALMQLENTGYAKNRWSSLFVDHSRNFSPFGDAIDITRLRGTQIQLYNFPLCTVPEKYREHAVRSISDWKQRFAQVCQECNAKTDCCGFFEWHPDTMSYEGIAPL